MALACVSKRGEGRGRGEWAKVVTFTGMAKAKAVKAAATTAAEIMMDHPQHLVCNAASVKSGVRIMSVALPAEEALVGGTLYYVLPMSMQSPVSASQASLLTFRARAALHGCSSTSAGVCGSAFSSGRAGILRLLRVVGSVAALRGAYRVLSLSRNQDHGRTGAVAPLDNSAEEEEQHRQNLLSKEEEEEEDDDSASLKIQMMQRRLSACRPRPWKPALETIAEWL